MNDLIELITELLIVNISFKVLYLLVSSVNIYIEWAYVIEIGLNEI